MLKAALELIGQIPATFWGVVCGSFFSILGVWLSNRASTSRLRDQFAHEREVKASERELALKKEIYLAATEAISAAMSGINNIANLEMPNDKVLAQYQEKSPAISKLHVVADLPLLQAALRFSGAFSSAVLKAFAGRARLLVEVNRIAILDRTAARHGKDAEGVLEMIKQYNINGVNDPRKWDLLQRNFEYSQKQRTDASTQATALREGLAVKRVELTRQCVAATNEIAVLLFPYLAAVRSELQIPVAVGAYRQSFEEMLSQQNLDFDQYLMDVSAIAGATKSAEKTGA